jgi:hypothetical protein
MFPDAMARMILRHLAQLRVAGLRGIGSPRTRGRDGAVPLVTAIIASESHGAPSADSPKHF